MSCPEVAFLPDEVVIEILARLPVKSLSRAKIVSKLWYKLASEKHLVRLCNEVSVRNSTMVIEVSESSSDASLICVDNLGGVYELRLDFMKDRVKVRASCNGLLCCSSIVNEEFYVCNPITRELRLLPYPGVEAALAGLACDLSGSKFHVVLAGYEYDANYETDGTFYCSVFDSESNEWRQFVSLQDVHIFSHMNKNQVVFVDGALRWLTDGSCIVVLDLSKDLWRKMVLTDEVGRVPGKRLYLLEFEGSLSVIQISKSWMNTWVLKNYDMGDWYLLDRVSLSVRLLRGLVPGIPPISQTREDVLLATNKQIFAYQRKSGVWKQMFSVNNGFTLPLWFMARSFRGTMLPCH